MATFVLISGAWHAAWCWDRVTPLLVASGHTVVAPNLLGMTDDGVALGDVTLASWAEQVADVIAAQAEPVVLLGHSRGGIVISEAAERIPGRISTLVYLAAFLLQDGDRLLEKTANFGFDTEEKLVRSADMLSTSIRSDAVGPVFYNLTDQEWTARAVSQVVPEPVAVVATPMTLTQAGFGSVRRSYIECLHDNAVPIAFQRQMQALLPCEPVFTLDSDHSPFFSAPDKLVDCLLKLA